MSARSSMNLEDIRNAMMDLKPQLDGFVGGWASSKNESSNLGLVNSAPPVSEPEIRPSTEDLPEMLMARFYYWNSPTNRDRQVLNYDERYARPLTAIDVIITKPAEHVVGILFSTRTRSYITRRDGVLKSLEKILQTQNPEVLIDRGESLLKLENEEIFLWLVVRLRDKPQIAPDILLSSVEGMSSRDEARRSADLKSGVDLSRPNFLTSVAEKDTLGPIDLRFVHHPNGNNDAYRMRLHIDGGFEIKKNQLHVADQLNKDNFMEETALYFAYKLVPQINSLFVADKEDWETEILEIIKEAMDALAERYNNFKSILEAKMQTNEVD